MIAFQIESWTSYARDAVDLWTEEAADVGAPAVEPNFAAYDQLSQAGLLRCLTARTEAGEMVGHVLWVLTPHMHHVSMVHAIVDTFYLRREWRKGWTGAQLIRKAVRLMREDGAARAVFSAAACEAERVERLMRAFGFKRSQVTFCKGLA